MPNDLFIPKSPEDFITHLLGNEFSYARRYGYPLAAMVACACGESKFGTSDTYKLTRCPFNLQKPSYFEWPKCPTIPFGTINKEGEKAKPSPFCVATDLMDASRLWCEWIWGWPNKKARDALVMQRNNPLEFTKSLFLVGFAEGKREKTEKFTKFIDDFKLIERAQEFDKAVYA